MICDHIGHKFRPRYSITTPTIQKFFENVIGEVQLSFGVLDKMQDKKYEGDICERCGKIIPPLQVVNK